VAALVVALHLPPALFVGSATIDLQTYDLVDSMLYLNLKSDFGVHRARRFPKWQLAQVADFVTETGRAASA